MQLYTFHTPNAPKVHKTQLGEVKKMYQLSPITSYKGVSYGHKIAARAATLRVACHKWTVYCGVGGPPIQIQGEPPTVLTPPFPRRV